MSANEVWAGSLGSFVVMTVIAYMLLNVCLKETGVIDRIALWFITRRFVRGRPYAFLAMFFFVQSADRDVQTWALPIWIPIC